MSWAEIGPAWSQKGLIIPPYMQNEFSFCMQATTLEGGRKRGKVTWLGGRDSGKDVWLVAQEASMEEMVAGVGYWGRNA